MTATRQAGGSISGALRAEIRAAEEQWLSVVAIRVERVGIEGVVVATPLSQKQAVWMAERRLLEVRLCTDEKRELLREVILHPADWAQLHDELVGDSIEYGSAASGYVRGAKSKDGRQRVTRVFGVPVVSFIR